MRKFSWCGWIFLTLIAVGCTTVPTAPESPERGGWEQEEVVIAQAIILRAKRLEEKLGIRFDPGWTPRVSLEFTLRDRRSRSYPGEYRAQTETIHFPISLTYEINREYRTSFYDFSPERLAADASFAELADHELGHVYMDQVSRRNGLGVWFDPQVYLGAARGRQLGINIVSEGVGMHFQYVFFPRGGALTPLSFPQSLEEEQWYHYDLVVFHGGLWLVRPILKEYGERGVVWLIRNPLVVGDNMRASVIAYQQRALAELASSR